MQNLNPNKRHSQKLRIHPFETAKALWNTGDRVKIQNLYPLENRSILIAKLFLNIGDLKAKDQFRRGLLAFLDACNPRLRSRLP